MKELNLRNITMMAAVASCFSQIGAQLYALSVVASTVSAAPPRSFALLQGEYRYDSSAFWETVPLITFVLFVIALVANWKTRDGIFYFSHCHCSLSAALWPVFIWNPFSMR